MKSWKVLTPGAKPFTELGLKRDARKAALDKAAKEAVRSCRAYVALNRVDVEPPWKFPPTLAGAI